MQNVETRPQGKTGEQRLLDHSIALRALIRAHNARGTVTLTTGAASTVVSSENIKADAIVSLTPASAAAAAELAVYVSAVADGSFTVTHPNNATAGRTWNWHAPSG